MSQEPKKTVGEHSLELQQKAPESRDPIELQREMQKDYEKNFMEALETGKKLYTGNFYVEVNTKKERLMQNVIRNYFIPRQSCPTPTYDQAVYKYDFENDDIQFLWVLPDKGSCHHLKENALQVHPSERELLLFVLSFYDGSLLDEAKRQNNEQEDTILLDNKEGRAWKKITT